MEKNEGKACCAGTWRGCQGVWSGSLTGREPSTWTAAESSICSPRKKILNSDWKRQQFGTKSSNANLSIWLTRGRSVVATERYQAVGSLTVNTNLPWIICICICICLNGNTRLPKIITKKQITLSFVWDVIYLCRLTWLLEKQQKFASNTEDKGCRKPHWGRKQISEHRWIDFQILLSEDG